MYQISGMYQLSSRYKLDLTCICCPIDAILIGHVTVVRYVSVVKLMQIRSDKYPLSG